MFGRKDDQLSPEGLKEREIAELREQKGYLQATVEALEQKTSRLAHDCALYRKWYHEGLLKVEQAYTEVERLKRQLQDVRESRETLRQQRDAVQHTVHASDDPLNIYCHRDTIYARQMYLYGKGYMSKVAKLERQLHFARRWNDRLRAGWRKQVQRLYAQCETRLEEQARYECTYGDCPLPSPHAQHRGER